MAGLDKMEKLDNNSRSFMAMLLLLHLLNRCRLEMMMVKLQSIVLYGFHYRSTNGTHMYIE